MGYPTGFTYVKGPVKYVLSTLSSTCTVRARNPVTLSDDRTVIEADSDSSAIYGIAVHDAADSLPAGKILIEIPTADTVYANVIATNVVASALSVGQAWGITKSGNHLRMNPASDTTRMLTVVPRDDFSTCDSNDSSVFCSWLGNVLGVFSSNASVNIFAQN